MSEGVVEVAVAPLVVPVPVVPEKLAPSPNPSLMQTVPMRIFGAFQEDPCGLTCKKCDEVPLMPLSLPCGCTFCRGCFEKLAGLDKCSACPETLVRDDKKGIVNVPAFSISGKLKTHTVSCLYERRGCKDKIIFGVNGEAYISHLKECKYALVSCVDCKEVMTKEAYVVHKPDADVCPDFVLMCKICKSEYRKKDTTAHKRLPEHVFKAVEQFEHLETLVQQLDDRLEAFARRTLSGERLDKKKIDDISVQIE
ncbi:MAG: TNF receptor-associated factor 2-like isoform X1, partial [Harvfovirus sp.]